MALFQGIEGCVVIAEVAQAHDGDIELAHAYIDAAAQAGAQGIKFQTHIAEAESTLKEPWRVKFSVRDKTRFDYWKRMEFTEAQWVELRAHAKEKGLLFVSSPFSIKAVDLLSPIGVDAWKIASGEVGNLPMIEAVAATDTPILLSSGMSPWTEIDQAVAILKAHAAQFAVMQCTSVYPTPPEKTGLNILGELHQRYGCAVGLSDHSGTIFPALACAGAGALDVLEVHVTFSREDSGPDVPASITFEEMKILIEGLRFIEKANAHPVDKDAMATELAELRQIFTKSIVAADDLAEGTVLEAAHLALKKPGTGLPAGRLGDVVGKTLKRAVVRDDILSESDLG